MKLSIVIPVYNGERFIKSCLDNILPHLDDNIELLFVNDGSTDNTEKLLKEDKFRGMYSCISIDNSGALNARITGTEAASGDYIYFMDVDDTLSTDFFVDIPRELECNHPDIVFFGADKRPLVNKVLGKLRIAFADHQGLKRDDEVALCWVTDFPFYEYDESRGKVDFGHNPFSMPRGGLEALQNATTDEQKLAITADQYDMVMNGYEVCSGAVRNHNPDIMYQVFGLLGYDKEYVDQKFGAMLNAFKYGAPPHAGCAYGLDRIFMVMENTDNIRDIVAFPKNGSGMDLMMNSPSTVFDSQLKELHIQPAVDTE